MKLSLRFSRTIMSAPDTSKKEVLYQPSAHISKQIDSMGITVTLVMMARVEGHAPRWLFHGTAEAHRTPRKPRCYAGHPTLSPGDPIPGSSVRPL
jgi:hypothetical protein